MVNRSSKAVFAALAVLVFSSAAFAADAPAKSEVKDLARVEVTGSRMAESIEEIPAAAYVVTKEDIANNGIRNVQEALARIPGITVDQYASSMTQNKTVKVRGLGMEVLLLVDGVPFMNSNYMSGASAFDLRSIPIDNIERIEVVKGSSSAVYGSAAAGGVINIITRKGAKKSSGMTKLESGSNGWFRGTVRGTAVAESGLSATVGYTKTRETGDTLMQYYDAQYDWTTGALLKPAGIDRAIDYDANDYNFKVEKGAWSLTGDWGDRDASWTYQGDLNADRNKYARIALNYNDGVNVGRAYFHKQNNDSQTGGYGYENKAFGLTFNRRQELFGHNFVYGVDWRREDLEKIDFGTTTLDRSRNGIAPYIETTVALGAVNMDLGLRYEHWSVDDAEDIDEFIPRVSFNYETKSGKLLYATAGRYFMTPSFTMYLPWYNQANLWLKPEKGWTYDLGIKDMKAKNPWSLNVFYMDMDDKINYDGGKYTVYAYNNIDEYRAYGVEAEYKYNINDKWSIKPGFAYIHSEGKAGTSDWKRTGDPRLNFTTFINYVNGEWQSELGLRYLADRELVSHPTLDCGDIFTADISFTWTPAKLEGNIIRFACTNIFDKVYAVSNSWGSAYVSPERRFVISWEHQF